MSTLRTLLDQARHVLRLSPGGPTDGRLLERFRAGDDAAFELLVWRHGPMVLSVARRVLGDEHAAEDAFQTVFLALAQKGSAIGRGEAVGAWLYRVAYRTALRARLRQARRAEREKAAGLVRAERPAPDPAERLLAEELRPRLDAEIARLPDEYRTAFILCHLEGKTNEEAARELGCPVGTVQSRLSRARARLRSRLRGQGLGPESIPFILFIQRPQPPAELPPDLVNPTVGLALLARIRSQPPAAPWQVFSRPKRRWLHWALLGLLAAASAGAVLAYGRLWPTPSPAPATSDAPACSGGCHAAPADQP